MGDRVQVHITDIGVWLYGHWKGDDIIQDVKDALNKRWRWGDPEYLARIVFDEVVGSNQGGETSFGIGTSQHHDVTRVVELNCSAQLARLMKGECDDSYDYWVKTMKERGEETPSWVKRAKPLWEGTFDQFIDEAPTTFYGE